MTWTLYNSFDEFTPRNLYDVLKLRQDIFIIEQNCIYDDMDGLDAKSRHVLLLDAGNILAGYLRIVPPDIKFEEYSLGRIAVKKDYRGQGLGRKIVQKGIDTVRSSEARSIRIEAQAHLEDFYKETGFITVSGIYSVDDIPHLQMILTL
ncbi:MAG TPA: GNAT family N-acetyltransferase [Balneolaceae bacterium]|nr:GNAT family N-acetyltransferase [Balneolaceae bacterium]